jgi:signal transduction histidine kinase
VAFVVTDDGAGITSEAAARAKEPFFTTKAQGLGTGLGLAIAAEIVKSHRGEMTIGPNQGGKGTRALIEIPIAGNPGAAA